MYATAYELVRHVCRAGALIVVALITSPAIADTGAVTNGDWSSAATWTNGVPGATDNVYIGSTAPTGAAANALVTLSQNSSAGTVYTGYGTGALGTIDLAGYTLSAANLYLGANGGSGAIARTGGGTLTINGAMYQNNGSGFLFAPGDTTTRLYVSNNSSATTQASSNVANLLEVDAGSTLNLGADVVLNTITTSGPGPMFPGNFTLSGTLNANGHAISAQLVTFGSNTAGYTINNRGLINTSDLEVMSPIGSPAMTFNLTPMDSVSSFGVSNTNSTLPLGVTVGTLTLSGASSVTTSYLRNISNYAFVGVGSTLTLGANMAENDTFQVDGTLNANGFSISAGSVIFGQNGGSFTILNRGSINTPYLTINSSTSQPMAAILPGDTVTSLTVSGANVFLPVGATVQTLTLSTYVGTSPPVDSTATTMAANNVAKSITVSPGCTLALGADLNLSTELYLNGTLNANGNRLVVNTASIGLNGGPVILQNDGQFTANFWNQGGASHIQLSQPGDTFGSLALGANSSLRVTDALGQLVGLTISSPTLSDLTIAQGSELLLEVNGDAGGWALRWANQTGADHISTLENMISLGEIDFAVLNGGSYSLSADSSYTYINVIPVPEPSTLILTATASSLIGLQLRKRPGNKRRGFYERRAAGFIPAV